MNELMTALEAYRRYDPAGWVALYRTLPVWAGLLMVVVAIAMLLIGSGRLFRVVAAPMGAAVGLLWAEVVATRFGFGTMSKQITIAATVLLGGLGLIFPPGALFFVFGIPTGLLVGELVGSTDWVLGFFPGFIVGGVLAMAAHRSIGAVASSIFGGCLLVLGLLSALSPLGSVVNSVASQPWGVLSAALLFAIAGTVYQLFVRLSPEERAQLKEEKRKAKKKRDENAQLEKRWSNYQGGGNSKG